MPEPIDYRSPVTPRPGRSFGRWMLLVMVWAVGLAVWGAYFALILVILFKFL